MLWKTLIVVTGSQSPVVVVLSGSMEPGFYRGDILFLDMGTSPVRPGEILTKGDNNDKDDSVGQIHSADQKWLLQEHIMGRMIGYLPHVGYVTLIMNDLPVLIS
ncbi:hypothetical protein WJX73_002394 [Symbiochloris irregularis]|uniref:Signal peptidase complex catalytic subunit SEC11 n=1 Tax=Symbiochloris irregularis TaxID=706552 RepID=A0AAW1Q002_9CHLO